MYKTPSFELRHADWDDERKLWLPAPWQKCNTLLKGFIQLLMIHFSQSTQTIKDIANADYATTIGYDEINLYADAGNLDRSLVIGTGTDAVTRTDYKLQTLVSANIAHGTTTFELLNPDAATWHILIHRTFTNNTGAALDITEVGLYVYTSAIHKVCIERTLYNLSIANTLSKIITYKFQI